MPRVFFNPLKVSNSTNIKAWDKIMTFRSRIKMRGHDSSTNKTKLGFPVENGQFWDKIPDFEWTKKISTKRASSIFIIYPCLTSCQISEKRLSSYLSKVVNIHPPNKPTNNSKSNLNMLRIYICVRKNLKSKQRLIRVFLVTFHTIWTLNTRVINVLKPGNPGPSTPLIFVTRNLKRHSA